MSAVLYGGMSLGAVASFFLLRTPGLGWVVVFMSLCVIGVHGMLSGTASMDFGGKKNAGVAVGIIDGFVYLGTAAQSLLVSGLIPLGAAAKDPGQLEPLARGAGAPVRGGPGAGHPGLERPAPAQGRARGGGRVLRAAPPAAPLSSHPGTRG